MSPASRKIPPFLRNRYKAIYSNFSGDSVHQTVKSGPFGDRRSLLSENPGSGLELFAAVFQNTRVIWLLYKQRQDLIQKSTLRIHGKRRKMKSTAEPPGTRQCVRALRLSHMKLRTAFPRGRSAHGGSPSRLPLGSAGRRAARRLHGSSGESGGQRSVSPCSNAEGPRAERSAPGTALYDSPLRRFHAPHPAPSRLNLVFKRRLKGRKKKTKTKAREKNNREARQAPGAGWLRSAGPLTAARPPAGPFPRQPPGTSPRAASDSLRGKQTNKQTTKKKRQKNANAEQQGREGEALRRRSPRAALAALPGPGHAARPPLALSPPHARPARSAARLSRLPRGGGRAADTNFVPPGVQFGGWRGEKAEPGFCLWAVVAGAVSRVSRVQPAARNDPPYPAAAAAPLW